MKSANLVWLGVGLVLALALGSYLLPKSKGRPAASDPTATSPAPASEPPAGTPLEEASAGYVQQGAPPSLAKYNDQTRRHWVTANEPALGALDHPEAVEFTAAPHAFDDYADKVLVRLEGLVNCRLARGFQKGADGDVPGALADFGAVVTFARAVAGSGADLAKYARGRRWEELGLRSVLNALGNPPWPAGEQAGTATQPPAKLGAEARKAWQELLAVVLEPVDEAATWKAAIAGQLALAERTSQAMDRGDPTLPPWIAEAHAKRDAAARAELLTTAKQTLDELAKQLADPKPQQLAPPVPPKRRRGVDEGRSSGGPGTPFRSDPLAVGTRANEARTLPFRLATWRQAVAAQIALRLWFDDHGALPPTWKELVDSGLLPAAPVDAFNGKTLAYDAKRALVWSPGSYSGPVDPELAAAQGWAGNVWRLTFVPPPEPSS